MEVLGIGAVIVGCFLLFLAYVLFIVFGGRVSIGWGLSNFLLLPFAWVPFAVLHWQKAQKAVYALLAGCVLVVVGSAVVFSLSGVGEVLFIKHPGYQYKMMLPFHWRQDQRLQFESADVQLFRTTEDAYFTVLAQEAKGQTLQRTIEAFAAQLNERLHEGKQSDCYDMEVAGVASCEIELSACAKEGCYAWFITAVEHNRQPFILLAWINENQREQRLAEIRSIQKSFSWDVTLPAQ